MSDWETTTLGEFTTLQRGHDLPKQDRREGDVPILGSFGITGWHDEAKVKGPGVTVGRSGASYGVVSYSACDFWPLNTALFVKDFHGNDEQFAYYFLQSIDFKRFNSGSAVQSLNRNHVHPMEIRIPPLHEQRAIASILGALDDKIELNRRMNRALESLARAIFKSWFVDFDPVKINAGQMPASSAIPTTHDPKVLDLFPSTFQDSELGPIPEGWKEGTLGDVVEIFDSKRVPLSKKQRQERQGIYPYYGAASVMDHVDDFLFEGIHVLMGEDGSVVNDDGTPVLQYVWGQFWVNNHAHVLKGKNGISDEHLLVHLKQAVVKPFVTGAVQPKINQGNLKRIPFLLPSPEIAYAFSNVLSPLFAQIRANTEESTSLAKNRDTLLPQLLSGDLPVPAAMTRAEEALA